jgi:ABC-2 type transport system permease protein
MAEVDKNIQRSIGDQAPWSQEQTRAQFATIAHLRWRIFRNSLRRKGNMGDLVATIVMIPIFLLLIILPSAGAGFGAWYFVHSGQFGLLILILWAIFVLSQVTSIQLGQPNTTFDPTQLIRFPLNFRGYAAIRVFFGLLSPANAVSTLMSVCVAIGIVVAAPELWLYAFVAMTAYALVNIFFTRMLFIWVDRWLSTRRAREVFTALIFIFGMGVQYVNFTFNLNRHHNHAVTAARLAAAHTFYHRAEPFLALLPPGLTTNSIIAAHLGHPGTFVAEVLGVLLFTVLFFAIFSARLYKEFRGENLSDVANAVAKTPAKKHTAVATTAAVAAPSLRSSMQFSTPPTIAAVLGKEFLTLRRNSGIFYALVAPLVMVVLFANLKAGHVPDYVLFPAAVAYTMLGVAPLSYNSLGLEAAGIQFFFLAPVKMRDVFIAKNLLNIGLAVAEIVAVFCAITYVGHMPSFSMTVSVVLWAAFTMFVSMAIGNYRSVTAPKKIDLTKMARNQASPLSGFISIGVMLVAAGLGAGVLAAGRFLDKPWLMPTAMLVLAVIGFFIYSWSLGTMDKLLADHRDTLSETLCKA